MDEITTTGIILNIMPIGEYDRRAEILTTDFGRISVFARGARKPGSSLVSVTRAFAFGSFRIYRGKSSYSLVSASVVSYFDELAADLDLSAYGFYFLEVARYFSRENVEAGEMVKLLYFSLKALSLPSIPNRLVRCIFELKLLALNGLCPTSDRLTSGKGIYAFGTLMSQGCRMAYDHVLNSPVEKQFTFTLSDDILKQFESIIKRIMDMNVDKPFKSLDMIEMAESFDL